MTDAYTPRKMHIINNFLTYQTPSSLLPPFYSPLFLHFYRGISLTNTSQIYFAIYFNILIMSKKPQPQKENPKNKPQIVEQQNEPFLKTLQKKVRNINKKLTEIAQLQLKENLKAEQIEKINRKGALLEERVRIEETATLFKQTYVENAAVYRALQLRELDILARAIALFHSGAKITEGDKLASLWRALEQSDKSYPTVNESVAALSATLKDFANDKKLQKSLTAYVEEHGNAHIAPIVSNEEKIVSDVLEEKVEVKPEPVKEVVKEEPVHAPVVVEAPVTVVTVPEPKVEAPAPVVAAEKIEEAPKVAVEEHATPLVQPEVNDQKPAEGKGGDYKKRNNNNTRGGRGEYKGNRERREGDEQKERRQYKPKYAEKPTEEVRKEDSDSSDSEPEVRNFRKEEIKELQNDGFIYIKPKPKPKDPRELREAHDHQHGKKFHHHHHQQNHPAPPK